MANLFVDFDPLNMERIVVKIFHTSSSPSPPPIVHSFFIIFIFTLIRYNPIMLFALAILILIFCLFAIKFTFFLFRLPAFPLASFFDIFPVPNRHKQLMEWTKIHGQFFITFNGFFRRNFISSDSSILAEVFGREQFEHFGERKDPTELAPNRRHIFVASGDRWKELRKKTSKLFSQRKLHSLEPIMTASIQDMLDGMATKGNVQFNFMEYSNLLFAAFLSRIAFFTAFPNCDFGNFQPKYVKRAEELLKEKEKAKMERTIWKKLFGMKSGKKVDVFGKIYSEMISEMGNGNEMMPPKDEERVESELGKILLDGSMKAVGIETVTFALACAVHFISARPSLQQQIRNDIHNFGQDSPLLKAIIQETLRLCPIVAFANSRLCTSSTILSNGVKINKMDTFEADIFSFGRDPKIWGQNAGEFQPNRWLNGPCDHFSFGMGPRKCIGSELALIFLKMALSKICGRFKLISLENQDEPILVGNDVLKPLRVEIRIQE